MSKPQSPRPYHQRQRRASTERTRARLLSSARRLLMTGAPAGVSLEAVAKGAGVTRLTVYHQFGSRAGLLEAVYDELARRGRIAERLRSAFQQPSAAQCLAGAVEAFVLFWNSDVTALRRLRSMAVLEPDFRGATRRDERRREVMRHVVRRVEVEREYPYPDATTRADVLTTLTSFETFDALACSNRDYATIIELLCELAHAALELESPRSSDGH